MSWKPISRDTLQNEIDHGVAFMSPAELRLWTRIKVEPHKWQLPGWGEEGGGFWVVAVMGETVIWYNDVEGGFNRAFWTELGVIGGYWCNQDPLHIPVRHLLVELETGEGSGYYLGPPQPVT